MKWTGHILRMSNNKTVKQVFSWKPSSRRSQGRPKKRWMDCVEEDLRTAGISRYDITIGRQRVSLQKIAGDRSQWREWVAASTILTAIFPGGPGLASTRMSILDYIGANGDGDGGDNGSYTTCKAPVKLSPPTNHHPVFLQVYTLLSLNQHCQSTE